MKLNTDKASTIVGAIAAIVIGANIDFAKLIEGDATQISLAVLALSMGAIGWLCNKIGRQLSPKSKAALEVLIGETLVTLMRAVKQKAAGQVENTVSAEKEKE